LPLAKFQADPAEISIHAASRGESAGWAGWPV